MGACDKSLASVQLTVTLCWLECTVLYFALHTGNYILSHVKPVQLLLCSVIQSDLHRGIEDRGILMKL